MIAQTVTITRVDNGFILYVNMAGTGIQLVALTVEAVGAMLKAIEWQVPFRSLDDCGDVQNLPTSTSTYAGIRPAGQVPPPSTAP